MLPSSKGLLRPPLVLLIVAGITGALGSRPTECLFPPRWEGSWFQSGVRQPILISRNELSSKGKCLHNEGDKFLLVDQKSSCYRCVVIHEKHPNVLQYKETYCHGRNSLSSLCSYITGDALLYSMFREEALSVACPFRGPMTFSYNRGHGTCSSPQSNVDTCTDDSRLLFRYQACPDVSASESAVEELECLATWKEGSSRYLVGRLHHNHASSNEDRYRCFVYEKAGQTTVQGNLNRPAMGMGAMDHEIGLPPSAAAAAAAAAAASAATAGGGGGGGGGGGTVPEGAAEIYRVAQSGDATCNGLFSPMEGSRTMTLKKVSSPGECKFPSWLTGHSNGGLTWHTLDLARSYTFHPRNASLHVTRSNASSSRYESGPAESQFGPGQEEQDVKLLCNSIKQANAAETMTTLVAHFTVGCQSGYMCMAFYRRDGHVVEVQTGGAVSRPEEACSSPHFQQHSVPFLTLVTSSPESRQCPYLGKFTVTGMNRNQRDIRESRRMQQQQQRQQQGRRDREKLRHGQERIEDRRGRRIDFDVDKRRANNEYLVRERLGRRARSNKQQPYVRSHRDSMENSKKSVNLDDHGAIRSRIRNTRDLKVSGKKRENLDDLGSDEAGKNSKIEDFRVDMNDFAEMSHFWAPDDSADSGEILRVQGDDYFGDYLDGEDLPKKRSSINHAPPHSSVTYDELVAMTNQPRDMDNPDEQSRGNRRKRDDEDSRCSSEVTTLTIGCSTADRMEFQTDCVDDDAITAYSCHGRWFDAEGTQFVIATPLARGSGWSAENRPQAFRNARRLCFMYKESGGVVSLTASPVACQRGFPPPPPMLAFNATSIGQCMEENEATQQRSTRLLPTMLAIIAAIFR